MTVDWQNLYKVRLSSNPDSSMDKHDVIKTLIVRKLLNKHKGEKIYVRVYTEFPITEGKICDIYMENIKTKAGYCWEIQKNITPKWLEETKLEYSNWHPFLLNTTDWFIVPVSELSNDLNKLSKQLDKFIV